ncbi:MAG: membrane protein insertase YidC [Firmicutes bacterium]|nr:membrane protein insertase YidC [Bacillota bacterium]
MGLLQSWFKSLLDFFYGITGNYGLAIILLTLAIRLILVPLTIGQNKSMAKMKELQPKMEEIKEKYKDKPEEYQQKVMELYKEHNVNPMGGCLPMLLQLPVLFALFAVLRSYEFTSGFLWLTSLSAPDPYYILPILSAVTTYLQTMLTSTDQSQKAMTLIMPVFIGYISLNFPSGLVLYWVVSNIFSAVQQYVLNKQLSVAQEGGKA